MTNTEKLINLIKSHGHGATDNGDGTLTGYSDAVYADGHVENIAETINADRTAVRDWLGY